MIDMYYIYYIYIYIIIHNLFKITNISLLFSKVEKLQKSF